MPPPDPRPHSDPWPAAPILSPFRCCCCCCLRSAPPQLPLVRMHPALLLLLLLPPAPPGRAAAPSAPWAPGTGAPGCCAAGGPPPRRCPPGSPPRRRTSPGKCLPSGEHQRVVRLSLNPGSSQARPRAAALTRAMLRDPAAETQGAHGQCVQRTVPRAQTIGTAHNSNHGMVVSQSTYQPGKP